MDYLVFKQACNKAC